jgi:hypothetical protein
MNEQIGGNSEIGTVRNLSCYLRLRSRQDQTPATPQLWLWLHSYLNNQAAVTQAESRIDAAAAAGYTGIVMWDSGVEYLQYSWWDPSYMQQVIQHAKADGLAVMPAVAPYGHSYDELVLSPNLAEGQRVLGTEFQVDPAGASLHLVNSFRGLVNGGFENGPAGWFSYADPGSSVDNTVAHSGGASALLRNCPANCRLAQSFTVQPWRQYHLRMFYQTQNFSGFAQIFAFADGELNIQRVNQAFSLQANQGWTQWDYAFNSGPHSTIEILMGIWGGSQGSLWFDDVSLEETGLVYVIRGNSAPLSVYDPSNPSHVFQEGADFGAISDPQLSGPAPYFRDYWHQPMVPAVPAGSRLRPGQIVAMNWYAIQPEANDAGVSLTDPAALEWRATAAAAQASVFSGASGYFFGYNEMRHMDSTASAKALNMTPAQLLDWHFNQTYNLYRSYSPSANIYVWSDMFDPNHNAVNNYYLVEGDLTGSWTGLPADVIIMNWNIAALKTSATWFATPPYAHRQVLANYYDSGNGSASATNALAQVSGIPGIQGLMYTTWVDDYSQIAPFAVAARANWSSYLASLPVSAPAVISIKVQYGGESYDLIGSKRSRLPWRITGIQATFSEPIIQGNARSLSGIAATGFAGLGTNTLTWTFHPISQGEFTAFLEGSGPNRLADAAGHGLGNGQGFTQPMKVLWGDFNGDGVVNGKDLASVAAVANTATNNAFADLNGDGKVNAADVAIVGSRQGANEP